MGEKDNYNYIPLKEPIAITEQKWPVGTIPLVHTRTMTYMHEKFIRDCIEGILMQKTTFPVQVLIHDDASTDKTAEIVREYERKYPHLIKVYYQKQNSYTKNDKIERRAKFFSWRTGKYEAICEGDDYWTDPLKLQKQVNFLETNPDYGIVFTDFNNLINSNQSIVKSYNKTYKLPIKDGYVFQDLLYSNPYVTCTTLYRMEVLEGYRDYNFFKDKSVKSIDYSLWLHIASKYKFGYLPYSTSTYRVLKESMSHSKDINNRISFINESRDISLAFAKHYGVKINQSKLDYNKRSAIIKSIIVGRHYCLLNQYKAYPFQIFRELIIELLLKPLIATRRKWHSGN